MSLTLSDDDQMHWMGVLERRFIAAAQSESDYVKAARLAHIAAVKWIESDAQLKGSFKWVCDALNLEPDAVRRALRKKANLKDLL